MPDPYRTPSTLQATEGWNLGMATVSVFLKKRPKAQPLNRIREVYVRTEQGSSKAIPALGL